jgi:hypothetical protein
MRKGSGRSPSGHSLEMNIVARFFFLIYVGAALRPRYLM